MTARRAHRGSSRIGRRPLSEEPRELVVTRLPSSVVTLLRETIDDLGVNTTSGFVGCALVQEVNRIRAERGQELVEMPSYLHDVTSRMHGTPVPAAQDALTGLEEDQMAG